VAFSCLFAVVTGAAEGGYALTAFDKALLAAGLGNLNLVKVSSVLPEGARMTESIELPPGSLVPVAYGCAASEAPGELISAAIAVGRTRDSFGLIMEYAGQGPRQRAEELVTAMIEESFAARGLRLHEIIVRGVEHRVVRVGCVIAAVAMWSAKGGQEAIAGMVQRPN